MFSFPFLLNLFLSLSSSSSSTISTNMYPLIMAKTRKIINPITAERIIKLDAGEIEISWKGGGVGFPVGRVGAGFKVGLGVCVGF